MRMSLRCSPLRCRQWCRQPVFVVTCRRQQYFRVLATCRRRATAHHLREGHGLENYRSMSQRLGEPLLRPKNAGSNCCIHMHMHSYTRLHHSHEMRTNNRMKIKHLIKVAGLHGEKRDRRLLYKAERSTNKHSLPMKIPVCTRTPRRYSRPARDFRPQRSLQGHRKDGQCDLCKVVAKETSSMAVAQCKP